MARKLRPRDASPIPSTLDHQLHLYGLSALAAGVGIIALTAPADARVVYTNTYRAISGTTGVLPIDFNQDGVQDAHLSIRAITSATVGHLTFNGWIYAA